MKKIGKQILAAIFAILVGTSCIQLSVPGVQLLHAYGADQEAEGLEFSVSGGEATVIGCTSTASEIVIPSEYEGYPVTAIGEKAFYECGTLVSVTIPQGVTTLGDYAFGYCDNLTTIYMPVSVTHWGYGVSYDCLSLSDVYYEGTSDEWNSIEEEDGNGYLLWGSTTHYNFAYSQIELSSGLIYSVSGGEATVIGCNSTASEIVIPSEYEGYPVTAIGEKAFYECGTLVSVTIPQGVTTLGDYAFGYCGNLTTIYMPVSVTHWGYGVSYDCESLSDVYYGGTSDQWDAISSDGGNGYLMNVATVHYEEASVTTIETTVEVTTETTAVTDYGEIESDGLVFSISGGEATVIGCNSTASEIVIPSEYEGYPVTAIGEKAFYECGTLVSVTIPQGVTTLGDYAFGYCGNLTTIYMPVSVTHWGYGVSYDCESLSDVYYGGTSDQWDAISSDGGNGYLRNIATIHYQESVTTGTTVITTMTETTTTETTTTMAVTTETASTDVHEPCEWALDQIRVQPGDGMDEDLNFSVYIDQPISSYGLQGAIYLPDVTAELLYWPYMESSALMGEIYSGARLTTNMNELLNNQGNCIYFAMDSSEVMDPSYTSGVLLQLTFAVPDDLAVAAVAERYGLQLQRDADGYYYEFPVCWMEEGYDEAVSNGQTVMLPRYSYIDSKNQDVFSDDVVLTDGYIRVDMPLYDVTSDTYPETTTTTVTTTTTTTASSTFPTTDQTTTTRIETMPVTTSYTTELWTTIRTETEYWETEQTTSTTTARSTTMTTPSATTTSWRTSVSLTSATTNTTTWWTTTSYPSTDLTDIATFTTRMTTDTTATSTYTSTWMSTSIATETSMYTQPTVYVMANTVVLSLAELQKNNYQVEVPVTLIDNPGFSQLAFGASWDTAYLTLEKCRGDADMLAFTPDVNKTYGDFAWLPFLSTNFDVNGNMLCYTGSSLCTLTFTVSEDAQPGDIYPIVLNYESPSGEMASAMSEESLELMLVRGEIIITEEESTGTSTETTSATTASTNTTATTTGGTDTSFYTTSYTTTGDVETTTESVYTSASTTTETTVTTASSESEEGFYVELGKPSADQLYVGNAFRLLYSTNATNLIWKSTDESIATVNNSGMLTILDSGTVSIIVIVQEDPIKTDTITITIPEAGQTTNTTGNTTGGTGSSTTTTTTTTDAETAVLRGDADMDGGVDPDDAYLALVYYARRSVGDLSFTFQKDAALEPLVVQQVDVDRNGVITPDDAYLILCYYAKLSVGMTDIRWEDLM